jgi:hypothetical protein
VHGNINKETKEGGEAGTTTTVVELIGMARPFGPLKALDMDRVIEQVEEALDRVE